MHVHVGAHVGYSFKACVGCMASICRVLQSICVVVVVCVCVCVYVRAYVRVCACLDTKGSNCVSWGPPGNVVQIWGPEQLAWGLVRGRFVRDPGGPPLHPVPPDLDSRRQMDGPQSLPKGQRGHRAKGEGQPELNQLTQRNTHRGRHGEQ